MLEDIGRICWASMTRCWKGKGATRSPAKYLHFSCLGCCSLCRMRPVMYGYQSSTSHPITVLKHKYYARDETIAGARKRMQRQETTKKYESKEVTSHHQPRIHHFSTLGRGCLLILLPLVPSDSCVIRANHAVAGFWMESQYATHSFVDGPA